MWFTIYIDSSDEENHVTEKAVDKAINTARGLHTVIDYSLNKHLKNNVNNKTIECGIGVDYGKVLVTQVGMYGVESHANKEDEVDCVWVGNTTNYASKYSDIASGGEIFISEIVYKNLSEEYKEVWTKAAKYKGTKLFQGYVTKDYYLDFSGDLGNPIKTEEDDTIGLDTSSQLADGIKEIERLQNKLIQREKELAVLEDRLKRENQEYKTKYNNENIAKQRAINDKNKAENDYKNIVNQAFDFIKDIIYWSFCREYDYIKQISFKRWCDIDTSFRKLGRLKGLSEDEISDYGFSYIEIYAYYKSYEKSYEYMVGMAKHSDAWVYINEDTFKWACKQNVGWKLIDTMEDNLKNNKIPYSKVDDYKKYITKAKQIRGF